MRRRDFLSLTAGGAMSLVGPGAWAATADGGQKRLVVVMLRGAADGLNVVVPYAEDAYYAARPTIAIAKPGAGDGAALPLDEHFALHPALAALLPLWQAKQLAFIHAAGSPDPSRSHFDAQFYLETGMPGRRSADDGWMNRLLAQLPGAKVATSALAVGPTLPQILKGKLPVANLPLGPMAADPMSIDRPEIGQAFDRLYGEAGPVGRAYHQGRAARAELVAHLAAPGIPDAGATGPEAMVGQAERLAGLIARDRNIRLAFVSLGGWDTHIRQGGGTGQLAGQLRPLGNGLATFARALGPEWADAVIVVLSEFGRTVHENGDAGTDHGHGNVMWVLGGGVNGGRVYGDWPGLATSALYEGRDLAVTTDFRTVLAAVAGRHLRLSDRALASVFPGFSPPRSALDRIVA